MAGMTGLLTNVRRETSPIGETKFVTSLRHLYAGESDDIADESSKRLLAGDGNSGKLF
jgi:hypothetical protein